MDDDPSPSPDALPCPICARPLRRTPDRLLSALECERCGPFSDFEGHSTRARAPRGPDDDGSGPTG